MKNKYESEVNRAYKLIRDELEALTDNAEKVKGDVTNLSYSVYNAFKKGLAKLFGVESLRDTEVAKSVIEYLFPGYKTFFKKEALESGYAGIGDLLKKVVYNENGFLAKQISTSKNSDADSGLEKAIKAAEGA